MKQTARSTFTAKLATAVLMVLVAIAASAQSEKILYTFTGHGDGGNPYGGVIADGKGNLYGTTSEGGSSLNGTVFQLSPGSNGNWSEQILYSFTSSNGDGFEPLAGVAFDGKGNLYGTTFAGGTSFSGTVFQLSPGSNGVWTEKVLYSFGASNTDGSGPGANLVIDSAGNFYGTTRRGGTLGFGTIFKLTPGSNGSWTEKVLHNFTGGSDGANPNGTTLTLDAAGNIYGVSGAGGPHNYGLVFKLSQGSNGAWTEKVLYAFPGGAVGGNPQGGVVLDAAGNLYGVASYSVFELTPGTNGTWAEKSVHNFAGGSDGAYPEAQLIFDKAGNLYGTTSGGGSHKGTVFELSPGANGTWTETVLHKFTGGSDGIFPGNATLAADASGNLFGTTTQGGTSNVGVIFQVTP